MEDLDELRLDPDEIHRSSHLWELLKAGALISFPDGTWLEADYTLQQIGCGHSDGDRRKLLHHYEPNLRGLDKALRHLKTWRQLQEQAVIDGYWIDPNFQIPPFTIGSKQMSIAFIIPDEIAKIFATYCKLADLEKITNQIDQFQLRAALCAVHCANISAMLMLDALGDAKLEPGIEGMLIDREPTCQPFNVVPCNAQLVELYRQLEGLLYNTDTPKCDFLPACYKRIIEEAKVGIMETLGGLHDYP